MAQGERRWSTGGREATKRSFPLLKPAEYDLKLLGTESKVGKRTEPGKMPYVGTSLEVLDTATREGGNNQRLFVNLFTSLKPGKDGSVMPERADQINGLTKAAGDAEVEFGLVEYPDENDQPTDCLNPEEIKQWLIDHDGLVVRAKLKIEKGKNGYPDKNAIDYFVVETKTTSTSAAKSDDAVFEGGGDDYAMKDAVPPPPPPKTTNSVARQKR